jgi:hypothetical protein
LVSDQISKFPTLKFIGYQVHRNGSRWTLVRRKKGVFFYRLTKKIAVHDNGFGVEEDSESSSE